MIANLGKTEKLLIKVCKDQEYTDEVSSGEFTALINPETYSFKFKTEYCETQGAGSTGVALKFSRTLPQDFNFDFLFDGTGVVKNASILNVPLQNPFDESKDISKKIEDFKKVVFAYDGEMHRPNFLKVLWGTLLFKGVLLSMDIEYKLFSHDGTPIRAIAKCSFKGSIGEEERIRKEDPKSPDITHQATFTAGDKITLLAETVYSDQNFYIDVAKTNGLDSFRNIPPGLPLYFLPLA